MAEQVSSKTQVTFSSRNAAVTEEEQTKMRNKYMRLKKKLNWQDASKREAERSYVPLQRKIAILVDKMYKVGKRGISLHHLLSGEEGYADKLLETAAEAQRLVQQIKVEDAKLSRPLVVTIAVAATTQTRAEKDALRRKLLGMERVCKEVWADCLLQNAYFDFFNVYLGEKYSLTKSEESELTKLKAEYESITATETEAFGGGLGASSEVFLDAAKQGQVDRLASQTPVVKSALDELQQWYKEIKEVRKKRKANAVAAGYTIFESGLFDIQSKGLSLDVIRDSRKLIDRLYEQKQVRIIDLRTSAEDATDVAKARRQYISSMNLMVGEDGRCVVLGSSAGVSLDSGETINANGIEAGHTIDSISGVPILAQNSSRIAAANNPLQQAYNNSAEKSMISWESSVVNLCESETPTHGTCVVPKQQETWYDDLRADLEELQEYHVDQKYFAISTHMGVILGSVKFAVDARGMTTHITWTPAEKKTKSRFIDAIHKEAFLKNVKKRLIACVNVWPDLLPKGIVKVIVPHQLTKDVTIDPDAPEAAVADESETSAIEPYSPLFVVLNNGEHTIPGDPNSAFMARRFQVRCSDLRARDRAVRSNVDRRAGPEKRWHALEVKNKWAVDPVSELDDTSVSGSEDEDEISGFGINVNSFVTAESLSLLLWELNAKVSAEYKFFKIAYFHVADAGETYTFLQEKGEAVLLHYGSDTSYCVDDLRYLLVDRDETPSNNVVAGRLAACALIGEEYRTEALHLAQIVLDDLGIDEEAEALLLELIESIKKLSTAAESVAQFAATSSHNQIVKRKELRETRAALRSLVLLDPQLAKMSRFWTYVLARAGTLNNESLWSKSLLMKKIRVGRYEEFGTDINVDLMTAENSPLTRVDGNTLNYVAKRLKRKYKGLGILSRSIEAHYRRQVASPTDDEAGEMTEGDTVARGNFMDEIRSEWIFQGPVQASTPYIYFVLKENPKTVNVESSFRLWYDAVCSKILSAIRHFNSVDVECSDCTDTLRILLEDMIRILQIGDDGTGTAGTAGGAAVSATAVGDGRLTFEVVKHMVTAICRAPQSALFRRESFMVNEKSQYYPYFEYVRRFVSEDFKSALKCYHDALGMVAYFYDRYCVSSTDCPMLLINALNLGECDDRNADLGLVYSSAQYQNLQSITSSDVYRAEVEICNRQRKTAFNGRSIECLPATLLRCNARLNVSLFPMRFIKQNAGDLSTIRDYDVRKEPDSRLPNEIASIIHPLARWREQRSGHNFYRRLVFHDMWKADTREETLYTERERTSIFALSMGRFMAPLNAELKTFSNNGQIQLYDSMLHLLGRPRLDAPVRENQSNMLSDTRCLQILCEGMFGVFEIKSLSVKLPDIEVVGTPTGERRMRRYPEEVDLPMFFLSHVDSKLRTFNEESFFKQLTLKQCLVLMRLLGNFDQSETDKFWSAAGAIAQSCTIEYLSERVWILDPRDRSGRRKINVRIVNATDGKIQPGSKYRICDERMQRLSDEMYTLEADFNMWGLVSDTGKKKKKRIQLRWLDRLKVTYTHEDGTEKNLYVKYEGPANSPKAIARLEYNEMGLVQRMLDSATIELDDVPHLTKWSQQVAALRFSELIHRNRTSVFTGSLPRGGGAAVQTDEGGGGTLSGRFNKLRDDAAKALARVQIKGADQTRAKGAKLTPAQKQRKRLDSLEAMESFISIENTEDSDIPEKVAILRIQRKNDARLAQQPDLDVIVDYTRRIGTIVLAENTSYTDATMESLIKRAFRDLRPEPDLGTNIVAVHIFVGADDPTFVEDLRNTMVTAALLCLPFGFDVRITYSVDASTVARTQPRAKTKSSRRRGESAKGGAASGGNPPARQRPRPTSSANDGLAAAGRAPQRKDGGGGSRALTHSEDRPGSAERRRLLLLASFEELGRSVPSSDGGIARSADEDASDPNPQSDIEIAETSGPESEEIVGDEDEELDLWLMRSPEEDAYFKEDPTDREEALYRAAGGQTVERELTKVLGTDTGFQELVDTYLQGTWGFVEPAMPAQPAQVVGQVQKARAPKHTLQVHTNVTRKQPQEQGIITKLGSEDEVYIVQYNSGKEVRQHRINFETDEEMKRRLRLEWLQNVLHVEPP